MKRIWILPLVLAVECVILGSLSPYFWNAQNMFDRSRHFVEIGIMAAAMTFVILSAGIDLSVGSIMGLSGIAFGFGWQHWGLGLTGAVMLALLTGAVAGGFNGWIVARWNIPPLLVTLAGLALFRGIAFGIAKDQYVSNFPPLFQALGQSSIGIVPVQLIPLIAVFLLAGFFLGKSVFGRYTALLGENEIAALYAGIPIARVKFLLYTLSGLAASIAGLIYTARVDTAKPDAGEGYELDVIACVVLGGTKITGGKGSILGTFLGLLILGMLRYGLELAGIASVWITFTVGCLLIATAILNERFGN